MFEHVFSREEAVGMIRVVSFALKHLDELNDDDLKAVAALLRESHFTLENFDN